MNEKEITKAKLEQMAKDITKAKLEQMAKDIIDVQPMPNDVMKTLIDNSSDTEDLIKDGLKPVSRIGLLWIRNE